MGRITYADKEALNEIPSIADINKCRAADMNEIKNVVNTLLNDVPSSTAPQNPVLNDLWIDTEADEYLAQVDNEVSATSTNAIQNQAITNYVNGLNTYSETEQVVGTWINGKPLYRKIISLTNYTTQTIAVFNNANQRVVKINGCFATTAGVVFMYPDFASNGAFQSTIYMSDYYTLNIVSNRTLSNFDYGYIELLYYKTTD